MLGMARDNIVQQARAWGADYLFFVDDDMEFKYDIVEKLLEHKKDIACAIMFSKNYPFQTTVKKIISRDKAWDLANYIDYPDSQLFEIGACGLAATLIDMRVFDDTSISKEHWFEMGETINEVPFSEDTGFCIRARQKGYKIFCDSSVKTRHKNVGEENCLYWRERRGHPLFP